MSSGQPDVVDHHPHLHAAAASRPGRCRGARRRAPSQDFRAAGKKVDPGLLVRAPGVPAHPEWSDLLPRREAPRMSEAIQSSSASTSRRDRRRLSRQRPRPRRRDDVLARQRQAHHHRPHRGAGRASRPAASATCCSSSAIADARGEGLQDLSALPVRRGAVPPPPGIPGRALHDDRSAPADGPVRIAMWSGPRNLSTALMRSFGNRARLRGHRRAVLRRLSAAHRPRPSDARARSSRITRPTGGRSTRRSPAPRPGGKQLFVPEAHDAPHAAGDRAELHARLPARVPDPPSGARARLLCRQARGGRRSSDIGFVEQAELFDEAADNDRRGAAGHRCRRACSPIRRACCGSSARRSTFPSARRC